MKCNHCGHVFRKQSSSRRFRHRIFCGDSRSEKVVGKLLNDRKISLIITDPPYGVNYGAKNEYLNSLDGGNRIEKTIKNDDLNCDETVLLWTKVFNYIRVISERGLVFYIMAPPGDLLAPLLIGLKKAGFPYRHLLVWVKNQFVFGRLDYKYKHEMIIYGWTNGQHRFFGPANESSVWEIDKPTRSKLHPTMKPIELYAKAIRNSSLKDETIFDPFLGSGTLILACHIMNRRGLGIDNDPRFIAVALERWLQFTGEQPVLIETLELGEPDDES